MTMTVKVRTAAKDYPAFGIVKGQTIYKWRAEGKKHISLTDPREATAPVEAAVGGVVEGEAAEPKAVAKKRAAKAKVALVVTENLPPE